jgi:hypothetical protein
MFGLEDGVVATAGGEFDLGGAVVEEFSGAIARDFVHFIAALPVEPDRGAGVPDIETGLERAEGDSPWP